MKRRIQPGDGDEMLILLNTLKQDLNMLKQDNLKIMHRLDALEETLKLL